MVKVTVDMHTKSNPSRCLPGCARIAGVDLPREKRVKAGLAYVVPDK
jgi:hypothetical protein